MTDRIIEKLHAAFPQGVKGHSEFRGELTVKVDTSELHEVALFLRDDEDCRYNLLVDVYGADRLKLGQSPRFAANYELYSIPHNKFLRLLVEAPEPAAGPGQNGSLPVLPSVTDIWPTANWLERETYDLMGIEFRNHPWLRRIMMPDN